MEKDIVQTIQELFDKSFSMLLGDRDMLEKLVDSITRKKKFRIQINGYEGKVENINVQMQVDKNRWIHNSINRRWEPEQEI